MRVYKILQNGKHVIFKESVLQVPDTNVISINTAFPKIADPFICWHAFPTKETICEMSMKNIKDEEWLTIQSDIPFVEILDHVYKFLR
jgi:hypothetical protein